MRHELNIHIQSQSALVKRAKFFIICSIFIGLFLVLLHALGFRLNRTASFPLGIYKFKKSETNYAIGELVAFCPPNEGFFKLAVERGYLTKGECDNTMPTLIKRVVALEGSEFSITDRVVINGVVQRNSEIKLHDGQNRPLSHAQSGQVLNGQTFVLCDYSTNSFDSRYFGPIERSCSRKL